MTIRKIKKGEENIIDEIVQIHLESFRGFFLTFLGKEFLSTMYSTYYSHEESGILIATDDEDKVVGFLAYSENMSSLYRYMIKKKLLLFAWYSTGAILRRPKIFTRLLRALKKPRESERGIKYVELSSIGVSSNARANEIGTLLIDRLKQTVDLTKHAYITLETDADNNSEVNAFYLKNGFTAFREYTTREGRRMYEYRYSANDTETTTEKNGQLQEAI